MISNKENLKFYSSGEEAFRPEIVFNPYVQRMFQVSFSLFNNQNSWKKDIKF